MSREITFQCDICKKPTKQIVGKLNFVPVIPGISRAVHSNYVAHADVGVCCKERVFKAIRFRPRMSAAEYHEARRRGAA
jgi:hypothetical protein